MKNNTDILKEISKDILYEYRKGDKKYHDSVFTKGNLLGMLQTFLTSGKSQDPIESRIVEFFCKPAFKLAKNANYISNAFAKLIQGVERIKEYIEIYKQNSQRIVNVAGEYWGNKTIIAQLRDKSAENWHPETVMGIPGHKEINILSRLTLPSYNRFPADKEFATSIEFACAALVKAAEGIIGMHYTDLFREQEKEEPQKQQSDLTQVDKWNILGDKKQKKPDSFYKKLKTDIFKGASSLLVAIKSLENIGFKIATKNVRGISYRTGRRYEQEFRLDKLMAEVDNISENGVSSIMQVLNNLKTKLREDKLMEKNIILENEEKFISKVIDKLYELSQNGSLQIEVDEDELNEFTTVADIGGYSLPLGMSNSPDPEQDIDNSIERLGWQFVKPTTKNISPIFKRQFKKGSKFLFRNKKRRNNKGK